jgi:hypothetical protein
MSLKEKILSLFRHAKPKAESTPIVSLSKRMQRHEFILLQVINPHVFRAKMAGKETFIDTGDWRFFKHELANFCQAKRISTKELAEGTVQIHCVGIQENLDRGIRFAWRFNKL